MAKPAPKRGTTSSERHDSSRWKTVLWAGGPACLVWAAVLTVYVATLAPTVTAEDSGELLTAAWYFGIPHPPGYPVWTVLCGVFMHLIPFGEIAWRGNLFSALCTALAAGWLFAALCELRLSAVAATATALIWALSRWCWMQAVITEVYGLNSLFMTVLLYCAARWRNTRTRGPLLAASLIFGLGMGNHHTIALVALGLIIWIIAQQPALLKRWRLVLASLGLFAVGLSPYLYLPLRAQSQPPMNWGDPSNWERFVDHVTRSQYGAVGPTKSADPRSIARTVDQFAYVAKSIADDLTLPVIVLVGVGVVIMLRRDRSAFALVALWLLANGGLFVVLSNFDLDRVSRFVMRVFLIPVTLGAAIPCAYVFDLCVRAIREHCAQHRSLRLIGHSLIALAAPLWMATAHWRACDYSDYWYARDHGENLLACMLPHAMLFPSGDHNTFPLAYLVLVEKQRSDVLIADLYGYTRTDLYADQPANDPDTPEAWIIKRQRRPVYFATKTQSPVSNAHFVTAGMLYHLLPDSMSFDGADLIDKCHYRNLEPGRDTLEDLGADNINADYFFFRGLHALGRGDKATALANFARAGNFGEGIKELFNNIGSALAEHGDPADAVPYFEQAAALDRHYALPRWNLYRVARERRDWPTARERLEDIVANDPADFRAHGQLGFLLHDEFHDAPAAIRSWRESLRLNPHQPQVRQALEAIIATPPKS